jgi:hypothetical protein
MPTIGNATLGCGAGVSGVAVGIGFFERLCEVVFFSIAEFNAIPAPKDTSKFTGRVSPHKTSGSHECVSTGGGLLWFI